ncbi:uncharacterized protein BT62DRAFT_827419, partial [Guyanagaster necrorhizus]
HQIAFERACILHRDISVGNIMITANHRGFLIDWDHCVILSHKSGEKRVGRGGKWQFVSAKLLTSFCNVHTIVDNRDSSLWILPYVVLRNVRNELSPVELYETMKMLFE